MARTLSLLFAALLVAATMLVSSTDAEARRWHRGVGIGLGVAAGLTALYVISESARANGYRRGPSCRGLLARCDDGQRWACRRFNERCG